MFSHVWQPLTSGFSDLKCVYMLPWHQQNCIRACMYIYYAHYVCTHTYVYLCISMCKLRLYDRVINNILMMVKKILILSSALPGHCYSDVCAITMAPASESLRT